MYSLVSLGDVRIKMETLLNSLGGKGGVIFYFFRRLFERENLKPFDWLSVFVQ